MNEIVVIEDDIIEIVQVGSQGPTGPTGPSGPIGPIGPTGPAGAGGAIGNYGVFYSTVDQTALVNTATPMTLNVTAESSGVSISGSQITFANAGTYDIQFSAQVHHRGGGGNGLELDIWFQLNGSALTDSAGKLIVQKNDYLVPAWDFMLTVDAGDVLQIIWLVNNTDIVLEHADASVNRPSAPSLIVTVMQVMYTQQGPTGATGPGVAAGGTTGQVLVKTSGTDYATGWESRNLLFSHVRVLAPRSDRGYGVISGTSTVTSVAQVAASPPFTVISDATLTAATIESTSSTVGAELVIGIYECDQQTSAPTTLLASLGSVVLSSAGLKTISGLTVALQARRIYRMAATWNGTAGSFRGTSTGTSGLPSGNQYEVLLTSTTSTGIDTNSRAQGYACAPASTGVFDISPTWSIGGAFLAVPNYGIVVS